MCMEDVKIARNMVTNVTFQSGIAGQVIAPEAPRRVRLIFSVSLIAAGEIVRCYPTQFGAGFAGGVSLTVESPVAIVRLEDYGNVVLQSWSVASNSGSENLTVFDVRLEAFTASELR